MSRHERVAAMCEGKDPMARKRAKEVARALRKKGHAIGAYKCPVCGTWHVGHSKYATVGERQKADHAEAWTPRPDRSRDRPTQERKRRGEWVWVATEAAGVRAARDVSAHPIDRMEHTGAISSEQASAARDFEQLVRVATESPAIRDSTTIWEPRGHDNDDGPVHAVRDRRELYLFLGVYRDRLLRRICVDHLEPKRHEVGLLREALNEAARFFNLGKRC